MIAPAMNPRMYENPIMQRNLNTLKDLGWLVLEPTIGAMAHPDEPEGKGRMAEPDDIPLLVRSGVMERLRPEMRKIAKIIRKAVFTAQPIILRHHADADGICSAVAIEQAVVSLIRESGAEFDSDYYLFKRAPSKAPFYEIEDITRDLDFSLKDHVRFGQKMPIIVLTDNGSTEEDEPSYKIGSVFDKVVIVSADHDLHQLIRNNTIVVKPSISYRDIEEEIYTEDVWRLQRKTGRRTDTLTYDLAILEPV
jgi:RecJ-like exonuclease